MSLSSVRPAGGAVFGVSVLPSATDDPQDALLADLVAFLTKHTPSVQRVLELAEPHLVAAAGLTAAAVFELDSETGTLHATGQVGPSAARDALTAGKVFRQAAGAAPLYDGERMAVRLRIGGSTVGVLLLTGTDLADLRPDVLAQIALHVAGAIQGLAAEAQRQFIAHQATTIRRLFETGMAATSVEAAGRALAASAGEAFRSQNVALYLTDREGRIRWVHSMGVTSEDDLAQALIGRRAADSPVWRSIADGRPALVNDVTKAKIRPGGLVQTMRLTAYLCLPLMSAQGPIGMIMCGDTNGLRDWTSRDRGLAEQLSVEGALIVDSAEMRQAAQAHVAQLSHQAYHDSLTGLPNRSALLGRAEEAIEHAAGTGTRAGLLLVDLNGFKEVNDTAGHHAGDTLLQQVGRRLLATVREGDMVARLGGDEFAILLAPDPDEPAATDVAERICERLREPFLIEGHSVQIGGSVGIALYPDDATSCDGLMRRADAAMYEAKRGTKADGGGVRRAA